MGEDAKEDTLINEFRDWLQRADRARYTIRSYVGTLTRFAAWFERTNRNPLDIRLVTPSDLRLYRDQLVQAQLKPASVNASLAALRAFGNYVAEQIGGSDPAKQLRGVEVAKRRAPKSLTKQQLFKLRQAMDRRRSHAEHHGHELAWILRDELMVQLMLNTGLRVQELCSLNVEDVKLTERNGKLPVRHGKGRKYREIPLNNNVRGQLKEWLKIRPKLADEFEHALFVSKYQVRMGTESVRHFLRLLSQAAGIQVTQLLGHSSLDTTRIYTAPTEADLARAVARLED